MNRSQLANALSEDLGKTRKEAAEFLDAFVHLITTTVSAGEAVAISGFAKFYRRESKARMGRNPATGEAIKIPAKKAAKITPLKKFKESVLSGRAPKKAPAKKAVAKKAAAKRAPAKKATAKRAPAKKAPARKTAAKRR